ncbi:hypothetical protein FQZ97_859500 [compost metagenome]
MAGHGLGVGHLSHDPPAAGLGLALGDPGVLDTGVEQGNGVTHEDVRTRAQRGEHGIGAGIDFQHLLARGRGMGHENRLGVGCARVDQVGATAVEKACIGHQLVQRGLEVGHVKADEHDADHLAGFVLDRVVVRHVGPAEQNGAAGVGLALEHQGMRRVGAYQQRAHGAFAVFLFQRGADALEVIALAHEDGRHAAVDAVEGIDLGEIVVEQHAPALEHAGLFVEFELLAEFLAERLESAVGHQTGGGVEGVDRTGHGRGLVTRPLHHAVARGRLGHQGHGAADQRKHGGEHDHGQQSHAARHGGLSVGAWFHRGCLLVWVRTACGAY